MSRSSVKVISKQEGKLDPRQWGVIRKLDIDYKEFDTFMTSVAVKTPGELAASRLLNRASESVNIILPDDPIVGKQGEYIWPVGSKLPKILEDISDELRALFNLKTEVSAFGFHIFQKAKKIDPKKETKVEHVSSDLALQIGSRLYGSIGSQENLELFATSQGKSGTCQLRLLSENFFYVGMGISAGLDVKINDGSFCKTEIKPGFRSSGFKKNPLSRYFMVVDCGINTNSLITAISNEAKKTSNGSKETEQEITQKLNDAFGFTSGVDKIVESTTNSNITVTSDPVEPKELSEVDKVIQSLNTSAEEIPQLVPVEPEELSDIDKVIKSLT